jgi:hypothetical protein
MMKFIFLTYLNCKNSESPKELSLRNFCQPSFRYTSLPVVLTLTVQEQFDEFFNFKVALLVSSCTTCFRNAGGILFNKQQKRKGRTKISDYGTS